LRLLAVLNRGDEAKRSRSLFRCSTSRKLFETQRLETEARLARSPYGFDDRVVPHPSPVQKTGCDEKCRRGRVPTQYRQGCGEIVPIAIVERDARGRCAQSPGAKLDERAFQRD